MKWFRFYHDAIDHPKVQRLPGDLFKFWVNMLCLASRSDDRGLVKMDLDAIAFATRTTDEEAAAMIADLTRRNLLEECTEGLAVHNWNDRQFKSDSSAERVAKHRSNTDSDDGNGPRNVTDDVTETPKPSVIQITDTDTDTEEKVSAADATEEPATTSDPQKKAKARDGLSDVQRQRFDRWYRTYPRKVKPVEAAKAWAKITPAPTDEQTEQMIAKVQEWAASIEWSDPQYIPHPATWLNGGRWNDGAPIDRITPNGSMTLMNGRPLTREEISRREFRKRNGVPEYQPNTPDSLDDDVIETAGRIAQ